MAKSILAALAVVLALAAGCGNYTEPPSRSAGDPCSQRAFQSGGAHSVTCPGTQACSCVAPDTCCLARIDSNAGACGSPHACGGLALTCDGPEDCNGGVCCLNEQAGGGSTCSAVGDCTGRWLCRSDGDCNGSPAGPSCKAADFGAQGISDRGLDGLIAICQR